ncbi:tail fiber protein [Aeromonas phage ZPAH14]|uniref:Uncharacterized protein n=1 Tax=Aeromonas phage ZPAH14 TaxID=2924887 RepID=A0AAE9KIA0_9CAUD|nr:tail fiber protein [Aeromonas phage ZPAH14]UOT58055.1 hypothetical protein [Aeromonas phage ZPAH14]
MTKKQKITAGRNPVWVDKTQSSLRIEVKIDGSEWMHYCATKSDTAPLGAQLWKDTLTGKYGEISKEYLQENTSELITARINAVRMKKLVEANAYETGIRAVKGPRMAQELAELEAYRKALMEIESQPGFPHSIQPPKAPWN